jgi:hypothetical protein
MIDHGIAEWHLLAVWPKAGTWNKHSVLASAMIRSQLINN